MSLQSQPQETEGPIQPSITNPSNPAASTSPAAASSQPPVANTASPETSISPASPKTGSPESQAQAASSPIGAKPDSTVRVSLLLTNGARHPFTINKKFLQRRNITAHDDDPWNISVYDMKSLIWHEWLAEWETRPASPAYIRLIFLGGLLDDKNPLKDCRFSKTESNVVHMTVKPQDIPDEEDMKSKENKGPGGSSRSGTGCCIIL